ncbi:MAG: hypothetical protein IPK68_04045 [Bdellovibrionales bacterium]|nr:hypothetical protein [Bdellovibrionales bacterium]
MNPTVTDVYYHFSGWTSNNTSAAFNKLLLILKTKEFKLNRNQRDWSINQGYRQGTQASLGHFYVNMCCFTETPITFLKSYISKKGGFCIGMKKDWLLRMGGQNVVYVDNKSPNDFGRAVVELLCTFKVAELEDPAENQKALLNRSNIFHGLVAATEDVGLHHEREWRIVRNDLNEFMVEDYIKFEATDVESIWSIDSHVMDLKAQLQSHPDSSILIPLIKKQSDL